MPGTCHQWPFFFFQLVNLGGEQKTQLDHITGIADLPGRVRTKWIDFWQLLNFFYCSRCSTNTLQETNISPKNGILKMIFLFPRWDMLIPWRVYHPHCRDRFWWKKPCPSVDHTDEPLLAQKASQFDFPTAWQNIAFVGTLHKLYQGLMMAYWRCTFQVEMYLFVIFFFEGLVCFWSTLSDSSVKKWVSWLWEGYWVAGCKRNCSMQLLMVNILRLALIIRAIAIHEWTTYRRTFVGMVRLYSSNSFMG